MLIVDTSAAIPFVLADEAADRLPVVADAMKDGACLAPTLWTWEMANTLWKACRSGRLDERQLDTALAIIEGFDISTDPIAADKALGPTLTLAIRHHLTAYDAAYLELALRVGAELATHDGELRKAAIAEGVKVHPQP